MTDTDVDQQSGTEIAPRKDGRSPLRSSRIPTAVFGVLALVAAFVLGRVTAPDEAPSVESTGIEFPSGDEDRSGYWGWVNLDPVVVDTFDRGDASTLEQTETSQSWQPLSGTWAVADDRAVTTGGGQGASPRLVVAGLPAEGGPDSAGGLTEVTMMSVEDGAGLLFRVQDAANYWSVTADTSAGTWTLARTLEGERVVIAEAVAPVEDGLTLSVTQSGSVIRVLVEGEEYANITDAALSRRLQGGLIAAGDSAGDAQWDRFLLMRFRDAAAVAP